MDYSVGSLCNSTASGSSDPGKTESPSYSFAIGTFLMLALLFMFTLLILPTFFFALFFLFQFANAWENTRARVHIPCTHIEWNLLFSLCEIN